MLKKLKKVIDNIILKRKLIKLLKLIKSSKNIKYYTGFCNFLWEDSSFDFDEYVLIKNVLYQKIKETNKNDYPVTYQNDDDFYNYFFLPNDWNIRIKWLTEVISKL